METNKIYNMDAIEFLKKLSNKSIDLVLTDPPYGITKEEWDKIPNREYFDEIIRVSKNQIIFGANHFANLLPNSKCWVVWNKRPFLKRTCPIELIWTSFKEYHKLLDYTYAGNYEGFYGKKLKPNYKKRKVFFTSEKPIGVIKWLLENFSKEGEIILDCFAGTGTTGEACIELNRKFILIEKEKKHFEIIKERLSQLNSKEAVSIPPKHKCIGYPCHLFIKIISKRRMCIDHVNPL